MDYYLIQEFAGFFQKTRSDDDRNVFNEERPKTKPDRTQSLKKKLKTYLQLKPFNEIMVNLMMVNVIVFNVIMVNVIMVSVVVVKVIMVNVMMVNVIMANVIMVNAILFDPIDRVF